MDESLSDDRMLDRDDRRDRPEFWTTRSRFGVVTSAHYKATDVGVRILEAGGNAIDAAIATSLALSVVESAGSGLGGMAMMIVHMGQNGQTLAYAGPCRAPAAATPELVASSARYHGYRAVAVPTYVSVLEAAFEAHASRPLAALMQGAIHLAENGFRLTRMQADLIHQYQTALAKSTARDFFLDDRGHPPAPHAWFRQPSLGATLRRMSDAGWRDFYEGAIAAKIADDMKRHQGFVSADDLAAVPPTAAQPCVSTGFRGSVVHTIGPPAGGRTLLQMLNLLSELQPARLDFETPEGMATLAAVIQRARSDRRRFRLELPEDPDITSTAYARQSAAEIRDQQTRGETSHLCVFDRWGNAVSLTQSIERSFGAKVVTPGLGFLHNGYMKGFKLQAKRHPHYLRPGAVARSNAAPTILTRSDVAEAALGNTGSERMLSGILQVLGRLQYQSPWEAVHAPRIHVTPEREVLAEAERIEPASLQRLRELGYSLRPLESYSFKFGGLHLATFDGEWFTGVAEPRRDGAAASPRSEPPHRL